MHEACSNDSHTFFNAKEVVHQLKKDEGNSVTVSQEEDHICFWWIGPFPRGISYSLWFQIYPSISGWCSLDPWEGAFLQFKTVTISDLQASPPPDTSLPPTHHALLRKAVLQCLIACREQCCLSCYLLSFPALAALSEDDNIIRGNSKTTICHCKPHFQHLVVELGTEILCPSRVKQTWAESARLKFTRSKKGLLYKVEIVRRACYSQFRMLF